MPETWAPVRQVCCGSACHPRSTDGRDGRPQEPWDITSTGSGLGRGFHTAQDMPVATTEYERAISLPIWPGMSVADVDRVVGGLRSVLAPQRR